MKTTIKNIKVENMQSTNGNDIANQFIIYTPEGVYFQSYSTIIVFKEHSSHTIYLDSDKWDYSKTTGKYRNMFLRETKAETEKKIKSGQYILTDLNK